MFKNKFPNLKKFVQWKKPDSRTVEKEGVWADRWCFRGGLIAERLLNYDHPTYILCNKLLLEKIETIVKVVKRLLKFTFGILAHQISKI